MTAEEAGRKRGEKVKEERDVEFYYEIGKRGGERVAHDNGEGFYREIGRKGEEVAATKAPSAAGVVKLLKGPSFPTDKQHIVQQAEQNKGEVEDPDRVMQAIHQLQEKNYASVADVEKSFGQQR